MLPLELLLTAVFPVAITVAACYDLLTMQIPNRFPAALALAFLALALLAGWPPAAIGLDLLIGLGVLVITFTLFAFGFIGGGDAKLLAATVLWLGLEQTPHFLIWTALFGGVLSLSVLAFRSVPMPGLLLGWPPAMRLHENGAGVPYGVAIGAAALLVFPETHWFAVFAGF